MEVRTMTKTMMAALLSAALVLPAPAQKPDTAETLLQGAIKKEVVDGDLAAAIEGYKKALAAAKANRAVAAKALYQLGECYRKQGDAQARRMFERVIKDYSDQPVAREARARLAALGGGTGSGVTYRQVWSGPKVEHGGTISPDGRYLSYVDWETGDLALHEFATNSERRLTNKGTWAQSVDFAEGSAISRDGKQVAYAWYNSKDRRYELRLVSLQTSGLPEPRRLLENDDVLWIAPKDWSPDGSCIAVVLQRKDQRKDQSSQIGLVSTSDGSLRVLKTTQYGAQEMWFSPDGKYLGLDLVPGGVARNAERDVIVIAVDGSGESKAVENPGQDVMMGWSPDGRHLLFASDRTGSMGLWSIAMAGGKPHGMPKLLRPDIAPESLGVASSGALYTGSLLSDRDIHVAALDFDTGKLLSPPVRPVQTFIGHNSQPDWSPDGKYLAYIAVRNHHNPWGGDRVLAVRSVETGQVRQLRPNLMMFHAPRWAPDGRSLLVQGTDLQETRGIYRIDAQTGATTQLVALPILARSPTAEWSRDGKRVLFISYHEKPEEYALVERDINSGAEREIIRGKRFLRRPLLSPDGGHIAVESHEPGVFTAVMLIPIQGGEARELLRVNRPQVMSLLAWAPDGRGVIAWTYALRELWFIAASDGSARKLGLDLGGNFRPSDPFSIHPDGRQVAYVTGETKSEVLVLENFLPKADK
jgi:Tol biopolymer transport system component